MNYSRLSLFIIALFVMFGQIQAQYVNFLSPTLVNYDKKENSAIFFDGRPLPMSVSSEKPFSMGPGMAGTLTVAKVAKTCRKSNESNALGFKVAIKDIQSNTMWMYSEETFYEVEIEDLISKCNMGDKLIFMLVDSAYKMPQHEIVVMNGC